MQEKQFQLFKKKRKKNRTMKKTSASGAPFFIALVCYLAYGYLFVYYDHQDNWLFATILCLILSIMTLANKLVFQMPGQSLMKKIFKISLKVHSESIINMLLIVLLIILPYSLVENYTSIIISSLFLVLYLSSFISLKSMQVPD